jgi:hypothetical protein
VREEPALWVRDQDLARGQPLDLVDVAEDSVGGSLTRSPAWVACRIPDDRDVGVVGERALREWDRCGQARDALELHEGDVGKLPSARVVSLDERDPADRRLEARLGTRPGVVLLPEVDPSLHRLSRDRVRAEDETASSGLREELGDVPVRHDHALRDQPAGPAPPKIGMADELEPANRRHARLQSRLRRQEPVPNLPRARKLDLVVADQEHGARELSDHRLGERARGSLGRSRVTGGKDPVDHRRGHAPLLAFREVASAPRDLTHLLAHWRVPQDFRDLVHSRDLLLPETSGDEHVRERLVTAERLACAAIVTQRSTTVSRRSSP